MVFEHISGGPQGVDIGCFTWALQLYMRCVNEIAITTQFLVDKDIRTLRRLRVGEVIEILEGPETDRSLSLSRVRVKAV